MNDRHRGIGMTSQRTRDRLVERLGREGIRNHAVLDAIAQVPRHLFVDEALSSRAYEDTALPIGQGQTISQPYVVARMTEAVVADGPQRVLEVGTGSGYQTAVLATIVPEVYTVERVGALLKPARKLLQELGYRNIRFRHGDGYAGWPEYAPYDGILVTAAPSKVPDALIEQLAEGGRLVLPVGGLGGQQLACYQRLEDRLETEWLERVSFVPLVQGTT